MPEMLFRPSSARSSASQSFTTVTSDHHHDNSIAYARSEVLIIADDSCTAGSESPESPPPADISHAARASSSDCSCWPPADVPGVQSRQPPLYKHHVKSSNPSHPTPTPSLQCDCRGETIPAHRDAQQSSCCARLGPGKRSQEMMHLDYVSSSSRPLFGDTRMWEQQPEKIIGRVEPQLSENARRANQLFEDLKHSSLDRKKSEEVDTALVVMKCEGKKSVEKVREKTTCSREKSKKSKKRETFDGDRPDTISTIDLQKPKFIVKCKDKKPKEKLHKCPATCKFFNKSSSPRPTTCEDYHKSSKSKKCRKKDTCVLDKKQ